MATVPALNIDKPVSLMALIDPVTGLIIGTSAQPLQTATSNLQTIPDLTTVLVTISTATTTTLVAATAAVKTRVYRMETDVGAADVLTFNAASGNRVQTYGAIGFRIYDFATRPWLTTAVNTALTLTTTTTGVVNCVVEYAKAA